MTKINESFSSITQQLKSLNEKITLNEKNIQEQVNTAVKSLNEKITLNEKNIQEQLKDAVKTLTDKQLKMDQEFQEKLNNQIEAIKDRIANNERRITEQIETQADVHTSMVKTFEEQFLKEKTNLMRNLEDLKREYDILKVSFTVKEKTLLEKIKLFIETEMADAVKGKEKEVLMRLWIDELKKISTDFNRLKKAHPKEFMLQLNEIAKTIEMFKHKLEI